MSKAKLAAAKQFIKEKQYREARIILESTDHPKATEWLAKLPKPIQKEKLKNSPPPRKTPIITVWVGIVIVLIVLLGGLFLQVIFTVNSSNPSIDMTRTAIYEQNATVEVLIRQTQTHAAETVQASDSDNRTQLTQIPVFTPTPE